MPVPVMVEQLESQNLNGNLMGDPSTRDLLVYLPPSYATHTDRAYRTAYLLHGFSNRAAEWNIGPTIQDGRTSLPIQAVLDELVRANPSAEMIVVMPDGWSRFGCSQWVDSPVNGLFEQYVTREIVAHVDKMYRTLRGAEYRGVVGISSGGLGAWHLGSRNPDVFGAMSVLSADSAFDLTHIPWILTYFNAVFPNEPDGPIDGDWNSWLVYALGSCYSPNIDRPPHYVDIPLHYPSGERIPELWDKWLSYDPVVNWRERAANLRSLRGIRLDVGSRDEFNLKYGHRQLSRALSGAGIAHDAQEHDGTHTSRLNERIQLSIAWFASVLASA